MLATALTYRVFHAKYDEKLHQAVVDHLVELFPKTRVYVGRVTQTDSNTILVADLRLATKDDSSPHPVLIAQRITVRGNLDITDWLQDTIRVEQVDLNGVQIDAWPIEQSVENPPALGQLNADVVDWAASPASGTRWSVECLMPQPKPGSRTPMIVFHDALVRIRHNVRADSPSIALHDISGTLAPDTKNREQKLGTQAFLPRERGPIKASIAGSSTGTLEKFELTAHFDPNSKACLAKGSLTGFHLSDSLRRRLPSQLQDYLSQLSGLECKASGAFEILTGPNRDAIFKVAGQLDDGRLQDARLPFPLENISSDFSCENAQIQLRNMKARSGSAELELNTDIFGLGLQSPMTIIATAKNLELDHRLYQSLPPNLQAQWDKLQMSGRVSGNVSLRFDGEKWTPSLSVMCEDVAIRPWLFPYPLTNLQGHVTYHNSRISCQHMIGNAGGQQLQGSFSLEKIVEEWVGRLECAAAGPVSVDEQLIAALTPRDKTTTGAETFVRSLHPTGSIKLTNATFHRSSPDEAWHRSLDAHVYSGSIKYDGFQYPIYDIRGRVVAQDQDWWLDRFEGRNDSGRILCSGHWESVSSGSIPLKLEFQALSVPIEEELKLALPEEAKFVWDELQPSGSIDQVTVEIRRDNRHAPVTTTVGVIEQSASNEVSGRSLRLHPKTFPYWLTDVDCEINYSPGFVSIRKASAVNGSSRISLMGTCQPIRDGRWKAQVEWLPQTRLIVESELLKALPKSIRESLVKFDFRGPISVLGRSDVIFAKRATDKLATAWNCKLAVEDGQLADGKNIGALRGTVHLQGNSDGTQVNATGSISMDALTLRGIPVTRLNGPFALIGSNLYFGASVSEVLPQVNQDDAVDMTANALSGKLYVSGHGKLNVGKFYVNVGLRSAELSLLMRDLGVDSATTEALCDADVNFAGIPWNPQTYEGHGRIHLSEAQLYQLPFMIRLMNAASVSASDDSAFQSADIRFQIDGDRIPLQVACDGDVLRLRGEGWTNLRRELELDLYSYVGRRIPFRDVASPLLAESRYATFMLIEVGGSLDNPVMQRRAFPQIEATFQQIFPELAEKRRNNPILPWRR